MKGCIVAWEEPLCTNVTMQQFHHLTLPRQDGACSIPVTNGLLRDGEPVNGLRMGARNNALIFAKNFISHPKMLGSIIPSSSFLINRLLKQVDWARARVIVEYGPGTGCITSEVLKRLHKDGTLIAIDTNPEFVEHLRQSIKDPRFHVIQGSASDVLTVLQSKGLPQADYVISGIPFSAFPLELRKGIVSSTTAALKEDGRMLVYQFSNAVLPHLQESFNHVETDFELLNILPARLFYCEK